VSNFPAQWIDDVEARAKHLLVAQVCDEVERARAGLLQSTAEIWNGALWLAHDENSNTPRRRDAQQSLKFADCKKGN
jgi:hypothetical protein